MATLYDIVKTNKDWINILASVLPGGKNWRQFQKDQDCYTTCPGWDPCARTDSGPDGLICSKKWKKAEASLLNLDVLKHVLKNFKHYDRNDCKMKDKEGKVRRLLDKISRIRKKIGGGLATKKKQLKPSSVVKKKV